MRIIFLSDKLPVDPGMAPLSALLDFVERDAPDALHRIRAQSERGRMLAQKAHETGVRPTFVLVMPENVLQHWRELQDAYTGKRVCSKEQIRNLIDIDHPEWKRIHIGIATAIPFFLTQVSVQATDFHRFILNKEGNPVTGKKIYRPPVYKDSVHGD